MVGIGHILGAEMEKEAASPEVIVGLGTGIGIALSGAVLWGHRRGKREAEQDFETGLIRKFPRTRPDRDRKGGFSDYFNPKYGIAATVGQHFRQRTYQGRMAQLQEGAS